MSYLGKAKKVDLRNLALEIGVNVEGDLKVYELKKLITNSEQFKEDETFIQNVLESIVSSRIAEEAELKEQKEFAEKELEQRKELAEKELEQRRELAENERRKEEREFELEKLRLQLQNHPVTETPALPDATPNVDFRRILPKFNSETDDINLFLVLFERQMKILKIPDALWVTHLIGTLPPEISKLLAREPEDKFQNYAHVRDVLLQRFKMTAEKFRKLFSQSRKSSNCTWKDFYFEIRTFFEGWMSELKISTLEQLKNLMISDHMKKRSNPECKQHFLDVWEELISPEELAEKLDNFDNLRNLNPKPQRKSNFNFKENSYYSKTTPYKKVIPSFKPEKKDHNFEKAPISCYGCGTPGVIRAKCPNCAPSKKQEMVANLQMYSLHENQSTPFSLIDISICGVRARVCADTGASCTVAGERLHKLFQEKGIKMEGKNVTMTLADGQQSTVKALTAKLMVEIEGRPVPTTFVILPESKGNRTLLGLDFLKKAGIVLDVPNKQWFFHDDPRHKYSFGIDLDADRCIQKRKVMSNLCDLRADEGKDLTVPQRNQLNALLRRYEDNFGPGGEPTPYIEHRIDTGDAPPVATTPYLKRFAKMHAEVKEKVEKKQDQRKKYADQRRRQVPQFVPGDLVWVDTHPVSNKARKRSAKFAPRRDGPYLILTQRSSTSYEVANPSAPATSLGTYHISALRPCHETSQLTTVPTPIARIRRRGRPPKFTGASPDQPTTSSGPSPGRRRSQRGRL